MLYNKEYFWSEDFEYYNKHKNCSEWQVLLYEDYKNRKVMIPAKMYRFERVGEEGFSFDKYYKPCETLYRELELEYGDENVTMYDKSGEVICFDSKEYLNEEIGFFIDKNKLFEFLERNDYKIIWRFVSKKIVRTVKESKWSSDVKRLNMSDVVTVGSNGEFVSNLHIFED